jgi:hypothetical protein
MLCLFLLIPSMGRGAELWVTPAAKPADGTVGDRATTQANIMSSGTRFTFAVPDTVTMDKAESVKVTFGQ